MKTYLLGGALLFCLADAAEARNCHVPGFGGIDNSVSVGYMTVKSGTPCAVIRTGGGTTATTTSRIVSPPRFGRVAIGPIGVRYISRPGYVGPDAFAFQNQGQNRFGQYTARTIQIQVNVVP